MPLPQTKNGKRSKLLSETARHLILPSGIETTAWPSVRDKCRLMGIEFDPWQDGAGRAILAKRANGRYAAGKGAVVLSIPRQVGKTFMIGAIVFALCMIHPGMKAIWSAHHTDTAGETFDSMKAFAGMPKVRPYISKVLQPGDGKQVIIFTNGSRIEWGARSAGFGRGKTKLSLVVLDEAQILSEKALANMIPAAAQGVNPLVFMMGTPPKPEDPSSAFKQRRERALSGQSEDVLYIEFSADRDAKLDDRKQWAKANPSYPNRTSDDAMQMIRELLPSDDDWRREALGIWDENSLTDSLIPVSSWDVLAVSNRPAGGLVAGVKFSVDGSLVGLSVGVKPSESDVPVHVDPIRLASTGEGYQWIVNWLVERKDQVLQVVIDGKGSDAVLIGMLGDAGFPVKLKTKKLTSLAVRTLPLDEYCGAHELFYQHVLGEEMTHGGDPSLAEQVGRGMKRKIGNKGGWGWGPIGDSDDVTLLDSATLAYYGASTVTRGKRKKGGLIQ